MIDESQAPSSPEVVEGGLPDVQAAQDQPRADEGSHDALGKEASAPQLISPADQKKIDRFLEKQRMVGYPLKASPDGKIASDSYGRLYMRECRAGNIRVVILDGKPLRVRKNKALRKAELKAIRMARKAALRKESIDKKGHPLVGDGQARSGDCR